MELLVIIATIAFLSGCIVGVLIGAAFPYE